MVSPRSAGIASEVASQHGAGGDQDRGDGDVDRGTGQGDPELLLRVLGDLDPRHAADRQQGDVPDLDAVALGGDGVAELVQGDADEEEEGRDDAVERALQPGIGIRAPVVGRPDEDEGEGERGP